MKSKKMKKLAKLIHEEVRNFERPMKISEEISGGDWSEYDPEVSAKFKKMVLNLSNYKNNINININTDRISISTNDITLVKVSTKKSQNTLYNEEDFVEMSLTKNFGFSVNYGYRLRSNYKDDQSYYKAIIKLL